MCLIDDPRMSITVVLVSGWAVAVIRSMIWHWKVLKPHYWITGAVAILPILLRKFLFPLL
jgi:hypothetical protein